MSIVTLDNTRLATIGLDSAWLAEGGISDHGKLLIGERQVINALEIAAKSDPHITISAGHHPFQLGSGTAFANGATRRNYRMYLRAGCGRAAR